MIQDVNSDIGAAVKAALKAQGKTQRQLAEELGMQETNLSNMLAGRVSEVPERWQQILKSVGLKLVVVPNEEE